MAATVLSPPGATRTAYDAVLKEFYAGPLNKQLNDATPLLTQFTQSTDNVDFAGRRVIVPIWTGRSGGHGARREEEALPAPGAQVTKNAIYTLKTLYGAFRLSGHVIRFTKNDVGAFVRAMEMEMDGIKTDLSIQVARILYGDGTGAVAIVGAASTTTNVVLASNEALVKGYLYVGSVIDVGTIANPELDNAAAGTVHTITAVAVATSSFTVSPALGIAPTAAQLIFVGDNADATSSKEPTGLRALVSATATTVGTITEASEPTWVPQRDTAASALTVDRMIQMRGKLRQAGLSPDGTGSFIVTDDFGLRTFWNAHAAMLNYNNPTNVDGGFKSVEFAGTTLFSDHHCPWGSMFFLDKKSFKIYNTGDWSYLDEDGRILKQVAGYDAWEGFLVRDFEIGAIRRNTSGIITFTGDTSGV
jgi:hypothetical protein